MLPRKLKSLRAFDANRSLKVMQFNMLADGLCGAYSATQTEKSFVGVDAACLRWTHRGVRLVEEMVRFSPDVIALEECDRVDELMRYLGPRGYDFCHQVKGTSPVPKVARALSAERKEAVSMPRDGVALIYNLAKVTVCGALQRVASESNEQQAFGLAVPLEMKGDGRRLLFAVTHLKSTKRAKGEAWRARQIACLMRQIRSGEQAQALPVVLCCDLNANPVTSDKGYAPQCYAVLTGEDRLGFASAYKRALGAEPEWTTNKRRAGGAERHCIDYIMLKDKEGAQGGAMQVAQVLEIPERQWTVPNWYYPSDHFSLLATLTWND